MNYSQIEKLVVQANDVDSKAMVALTIVIILLQLIGKQVF
jgi:hypothetical protein